MPFGVNGITIIPMADHIFHHFRDIFSQNKLGRSKNINYDDNKQMSSIYCLKALGAFFVICIHSFSPLPMWPIIRTAVPFFFIISGFFLYRENPEEALNNCIKAFRKICWLTLYANIFYYISFCIPENLIPFKSIKSVLGFITVGSSLGFHLWYLNAYLEVLFVVVISLKFKKLHYLWWSIPICILWGLMTGKYEFLFPYLPNNLIISRNFFTMGIPCFGIGWILKKYTLCGEPNFNYPILLTIILMILSEFEIFLLKYYGYFLSGDYIITTFPLAVSMMLIGIKYPLLGKDSVIEYVGKKYSTNIYIFHVFILKIWKILNDQIWELPPITFPFVIFVVTIFFIIIWRKCSQKFFIS